MNTYKNNVPYISADLITKACAHKYTITTLRVVTVGLTRSSVVIIIHTYIN